MTVVVVGPGVVAHRTQMDSLASRRFTGKTTQPIARIAVQRTPGAIVIEAEGYADPPGPQAEKLARARYLLEFIYGQPVLIRSHHRDATRLAAATI
jgi:hypothetical protein